MNDGVNEEDKYYNIDHVIKNISLERQYKSHDFKINFKFDKGENYLGDIERAVLAGVKESGEKETLHVIIKTAPFNVRKDFPVNIYYERELFVYSVFLPMLIRMQDGLEISENHKIRFAHLYGGSSEDLAEVLVFEDLGHEGYQMYDRFKSLDYDHLILAVKTVATFHAYSFAAKYLTPELYDEAVKIAFRREDFGKSFDKAFEQAKNKSINVIENDKLRKRVRKYSAGNVLDKILNLLDVGTGEDLPYNIICHGDCWVNNVLFKYDEDEKPSSMVLIDWQMNNYSSPVSDLAYLLFSSVDEKTRKDHWDEILKTYYETLKERVELLGCDMNVCYPESIYKRHIREKLPIGLVWSFMLVPIVLNKKDAAMDLNDLINKDETQYSEDCIERLNGIVRDFARLGYI